MQLDEMFGSSESRMAAKVVSAGGQGKHHKNNRGFNIILLFETTGRRKK